jgi:hypothetical protein
LASAKLKHEGAGVNIMRILKIFLCLSLLCVSIDDVNSATSQLAADRFSQRAKNIGMSSYDFRISVIEHDGILIDALTVTDRNKQNPFVPFDNGGHLLFTSKNVFLNVTKGLIAMNLPAGNGRLVRLVAGAGSYIEFEPRSFTITSSVKNADTVTAILEGIEFPILPGETTRFIETNIIPSGVNVVLSPNTGRLISVAIFGSAHLDVNQIKIDSLLLESPALKRTVKAGQPATIGHINDDPYPDLMVEFEANTSPLNPDFNYAILKGRLSDGTIINSISALDYKF